MEYQCEVARIFSDHEAAGASTSSLTTPAHSSLQATAASSSTSTATSFSPLHVELTNGHMYTCDLIVSATGVTPNTTLLHNLVTENKVC